jgi:hypothetical protein
MIRGNHARRSRKQDGRQNITKDLKNLGFFLKILKQILKNVVLNIPNDMCAISSAYHLKSLHFSIILQTKR